MIRKYNYYAKRGKTIVGASDGEIGNANGRSYYSTAYGEISRKNEIGRASCRERV